MRASHPAFLLRIRAYSFGYSQVLRPIDATFHFVLVCAYTGKEVVECKVLMAVVEVPKDQVRWLRLRAGRSKRGFPRGSQELREKLQPAHYR